MFCKYLEVEMKGPDDVGVNTKKDKQL